MPANLKRLDGFTLIELMIVVAIIGILSALAYPSYLSQMIKSRRTDAQRLMISHAQTMERYFTSNSRYTTVAGNANCSKPTDSNFYTYANPCSDTTFTITATAIGNQASDGADGNLTFDNTGARAPSSKWAN